MTDDNDLKVFIVANSTKGLLVEESALEQAE